MMANLLADAVSHLRTAMKSHMSEEVTISNGRHTTTAVKATIGRTRKEQVSDDQGTTVLTSVTDFLIDKADYVLGGEEVEPNQNHVITRADGQKYKPVPMVPGEPPWRWMSDASPVIRRIHVIEVAN